MNASDQGSRGVWLIMPNQKEIDDLLELFDWAMAAKHLDLVTDLEAPPIPSSSPLPRPSPFPIPSSPSASYEGSSGGVFRH